MPLTVQDIADMIEATHKNRQKDKFNQIAQRAVEFPAFAYFVKRKRVKMATGSLIHRTVMLSTSNQSRQVGLYQTDTMNVADNMGAAEAPWRHTNTPYGWDVREIFMQSGPERIFDIMKARRADAELSRVQNMSTQLWSTPTADSDKTTIWGFPYWVVINANTGFNGAAAYGSTTGGLSHANWQNYTAQYAAVTKTDLIDKMIDAARKTRFVSPISIEDYKQGVTERFKIFAPLTVVKGIEKLQEQQNDSLGSDVAPMFGKANFNRTPITWEPELDSTGTATTAAKAPVYMLDLDYWEPTFLESDFERVSKPTQAPNQHNVLAVHIDDSWNLMCTDRRRQAVIATA